MTIHWLNICVRLKTSVFDSMRHWLRNKSNSPRQHGRFNVAESFIFSVSCENAVPVLSVTGYPKLNLYHIPLLLYFYLAHSCVGPTVLPCMSSKFLLYSPFFCSLTKNSFVLSKYNLYKYYLSFPLNFLNLFNICNCVAHHASGQNLVYEWHRQNICYNS